MQPDERAKPADMKWSENYQVSDYRQFGVSSSSGLVDGSGSGFTGQIVMWCNKIAPQGWLLCDGQSYLVDDYPELFNVIAPLLGTITVNTSTDVFTCTGHGLRDGDPVLFESDDGFGDLPAPLDDAFTYGYPVKLYVRDATTDTFKVSATKGGSAINITNTGTGTHTARFIPYDVIGVDNFKQNDPLAFFVPFMLANMPVGYDHSGDYNTLSLGEFDQVAAHRHPLSGNGQAQIYATGNVLYQVGSGVGFTSSARGTGLTTGSNVTSINNSARLMGQTDDNSSNGTPTTPYVVTNFIIKT